MGSTKNRRNNSKNIKTLFINSLKKREIMNGYLILKEEGNIEKEAYRIILKD